MIEAVSGGMLNRQELARVRVILHIPIGFDEKFVAGNKATTPPGHIEGLARRMQLQPDLLGPWCCQKTQRLAFKHKSRISRIMNDNQFVPLRKGYRFGE